MVAETQETLEIRGILEEGALVVMAVVQAYLFGVHLIALIHRLSIFLYRQHQLGEPVVILVLEAAVLREMPDRRGIQELHHQH